MRTIDLNADVGEGSEAERDLLPLVSSASVACGGHAGDQTSMRDAVTRALQLGVTIGAHPGYPDRSTFGRVDIRAKPADIERWIVEQVQQLQSACAAIGTRVAYVKPHGALYNRAWRDHETAAAIVASVRNVDPTLVILGASGSALIEAASGAGLHTAREAFLDRGYAADGALVSRTQHGALIDDPDTAAARAVALARQDPIEAVDGSTVTLNADSLCVHGDSPLAVSIARRARERLQAAGIQISAFV
jgi:5-oxoprolinase (ATP-hydrolysing) subunit A